jgi:hypothetical protein
MHLELALVLLYAALPCLRHRIQDKIGAEAAPQCDALAPEAQVQLLQVLAAGRVQEQGATEAAQPERTPKDTRAA